MISLSLPNKSSIGYVTITKEMKDYKESTPVFSYYVLTCINLMNLNSFITWCSQNNKIIFNFDTHDDNLEKYVQFIKKVRTNKYFIKNISCIQSLLENNEDDWLNNTLRMSINQISFI